MKIKIKSITDVITNSSTEVFTIIDKESINTIKEMVNNIFAMCNYPHTFDDIFDIELDIETDGLEDYYEDWLIENEPSKLSEWRKLGYRDQYDVLSNLDYHILVELAQKHDEKCVSDGEGWNAIRGLIVNVKKDIVFENKEIVEKVAAHLSNIDGIFETEARYC